VSDRSLAPVRSALSPARRASFCPARKRVRCSATRANLLHLTQECARPPAGAARARVIAARAVLRGPARLLHGNWPCASRITAWHFACTRCCCSICFGAPAARAFAPRQPPGAARSLICAPAAARQEIARRMRHARRRSPWQHMPPRLPVSPPLRQMTWPQGTCASAATWLGSNPPKVSRASESASSCRVSVRPSWRASRPRSAAWMRVADSDERMLQPAHRAGRRRQCRSPATCAAPRQAHRFRARQPRQGFRNEPRRSGRHRRLMSGGVRARTGCTYSGCMARSSPPSGRMHPATGFFHGGRPSL